MCIDPARGVLCTRQPRVRCLVYASTQSEVYCVRLDPVQGILCTCRPSVRCLASSARRPVCTCTSKVRCLAYMSRVHTCASTLHKVPCVCVHIEDEGSCMASCVCVCIKSAHRECTRHPGYVCTQQVSRACACASWVRVRRCL
jgi:hypothetical protein